MKNAFTLVEMLIAVVLLTLLISTALFSFKHMLLVFRHVEVEGIEEALKFNQLRSSVSSMEYHVVDDYNNFNIAQKNLHYYFKGSLDRMRYITSNPLFSKETSIAMLSCEEGLLKYYEAPLYSKDTDYLTPLITQESRFQMLKQDIEQCSIQYFSNKQYMNSLTNTIPEVVKVSFIEKEKEKENSYFINILSNDTERNKIIQDVLNGD